MENSPYQTPYKKYRKNIKKNNMLDAGIEGMQISNKLALQRDSKNLPNLFLFIEELDDGWYVHNAYTGIKINYVSLADKFRNNLIQNLQKNHLDKSVKIKRDYTWIELNDIGSDSEEEILAGEPQEMFKIDKKPSNRYQILKDECEDLQIEDVPSSYDLLEVFKNATIEATHKRRLMSKDIDNLISLFKTKDMEIQKEKTLKAEQSLYFEQVRLKKMEDLNTLLHKENDRLKEKIKEMAVSQGQDLNTRLSLKHKPYTAFGDSKDSFLKCLETAIYHPGAFWKSLNDVIKKRADRSVSFQENFIKQAESKWGNLYEHREKISSAMHLICLNTSKSSYFTYTNFMKCFREVSYPNFIESNKGLLGLSTL